MGMACKCLEPSAKSCSVNHLIATLSCLQTDAQLWGGAALFGMLREVLPAGSLWTPIIHQLLNVLSFVETDSLSKIALYKQTSSFIQFLQQSGNYTTLHITGHSLGGGISIVSGAQTGIPGTLLSNVSTSPFFSAPLSYQFFLS